MSPEAAMQVPEHAGSPRERFERLCRRHGLALTIQRRAIFAALVERRDHPTADQVFAAVRGRLPGVSRTTVYRVLETLVHAGLITKACHPGAAARYDPRTQRHHHLVCLHCEKIVDYDDPTLDTLPLPRLRGARFEIHDYCIHFRGVCAECRARLNRAKKSPGRGATRQASQSKRRLRRAPPKIRRKAP
jgi:Fur family peroxide stress response transcriptional regulator